MQKIGSSTNTADAKGEFTNGDPQTQVPCTWVTAAWLNTLQRELIHLCEETGISIDPHDDTQIYQAIAQLLKTGTEGMVKSVNTHKPDEHGNVKLGSAADADIVESMTDTTAGRVPVAGWMGISKAINIPANTDLAEFFKTARGAFYHCDNAAQYVKPPSWFGATWFDVIATVHENTDYRTLYAISGNGNTAFAVISGGKFSGWKKDFTEVQKPTAADTDALPVIENPLGVDLNTLGASTSTGLYRQPLTASATADNHYPITEAGELLCKPAAYGCVQEYTTYSSVRKFVRGVNGTWNGKDGPWSQWKEIPNIDIADGRYLRLAGGTMTGALTVPGVINTGDYTLRNLVSRHIRFEYLKKDGTWAVDGYIYKDGVDAPNRRPGVRINCGTPNKDKGNTTNSGDWVFGEDGTLTCPGTVSLGTTRKLTIDSNGTSNLGARLHLWGNVDRPTVIEFGDDTSYHFYSQRNKDGSISFVSPGEIVPGKYNNFDARYLGHTALTTFGAVGSLAFLSNNTASAIAPGATVAGSSMSYAGVGADWGGGGDFARVSRSGTPAGTWRCMGYCVGHWGDGGDASLFIRIA